MSKFVVWLIEDIPESRHEIMTFLKQHRGKSEVEFIHFVDLKAACNLFDVKPKAHLICVDLYYHRPGRLHLTPEDVYSEIMGKGRFVGHGRLELLKQLAEKYGKGCPIVVIETTYTHWFAAHPLVNKRDAVEWEDQITSHLKKLPYVKAIISKPRWDKEKPILLEIFKEALSQKSGKMEEDC